MESLANVSSGLVRFLDGPLGWLLDLPRDLTLLLFATMTALLMVVARRFLTNQDLLHRCAADLKRLKELMRAARSANDMQAVLRYRVTIAQIKGMQFAADMRVLAGVIIPLGAVALWAAGRFDYLPIAFDEDVVVRAHCPVSSIGHLAHVVPVAELALKSSPITVVKADPDDSTRGIAEWRLHPEVPGESTITIRHAGESATCQVIIGESTYAPPIQQQSGSRLVATEVMLRRYFPLGSSLGSDYVHLPPWLIGYLILTVALMPVIKRLLKVD